MGRKITALPLRALYYSTVLPPKERKWKRKRSLSFPEGGEEGGEGKIGGREKDRRPTPVPPPTLIISGGGIHQRFFA